MVDLKLRPTCPVCGYAARELMNAVTHINDAHRWTREAIADWLYTVEESLGFITVLDTQDTCDTRDNNLTQRSPASQTELSLAKV